MALYLNTVDGCNVFSFFLAHQTFAYLYNNCNLHSHSMSIQYNHILVSLCLCYNSALHVKRCYGIILWKFTQTCFFLMFKLCYVILYFMFQGNYWCFRFSGQRCCCRMNHMHVYTSRFLDNKQQFINNNTKIELASYLNDIFHSGPLSHQFGPSNSASFRKLWILLWCFPYLIFFIFKLDFSCSDGGVTRWMQY